MNSDLKSCSEWDRSTLVNENHANFRDTFCQDPADTKLQLTRFYENIAEDGNERPGYCVHPSPIIFSDQIEYYAVCLYLRNDLLKLTKARNYQIYVRFLAYIESTLIVGFTSLGSFLRLSSEPIQSFHLFGNLFFRFTSKFAATLATTRSNSASLNLIFKAIHHLVSLHYSLTLKFTLNNVVQNVLTAFTTLL